MQPIDAATLAPGIHAGPFHERQRRAGGTFYEDMGALWTRGFGDPVAEYWAVRRDAALWDISSLVKLRFDGPQALAALDRLSTRRMRDATPGAVRYGLVLDDDGRMLDEATFLVTLSTQGYLFGNDERGPFLNRLRASTADLDVEITNVTRALPGLAIQGPGSYRLLAGLIDRPFEQLRWFRVLCEVRLAGVRGMLVRVGFTGELGYEFYLLDGDEGAERVWDALAGAGARPIGLDAIQAIRCELGLVIQEEDYVPGETDPLDLSMERFIDLDDHTFVGKAAISARLAAGPARGFKTVLLTGDSAPRRGAPVLHAGRAVGMVTSSVVSPRFGVIALAVIDRSVALDGAPVVVGDVAGQLHPLPLDGAGRARADPRRPKQVDREAPPARAR